MDSIFYLDRIHFAFTILYHYLFPQLTMGLAFIIVVFKSLALWKHNESYHKAARFWAKIFAINFAVGVVTGIPMEFQFGTNWAAFSKYAGNVIGQTLAMEGVFAFFMESSFLALFIFGEKRLSPKMHWFSAFMVFLGSWTSGYFILATNAWMQHPVAYTLENGMANLNSFWGLVFNPWLFWQYLHTMIATVVTGSFVVASIGAFYLLSNKYKEQGKLYVRSGVLIGLIASILIIFPTGDGESKQVFKHQPTKAVAMEGIFKSGPNQPLVLFGQPNMKDKKLDNPLVVPNFLSFLTYGSFNADLKGMDSFKESELPDAVPLVYYSYHIMAGLGTVFLLILLIAAYLLWKKKLYNTHWILWVLMLLAPFPYIATSAGWMTAEIGRQPWLVYGLFKTIDGMSPHVNSGNILFTLLGFIGMYIVMGILFVILVLKVINKGPESLKIRVKNDKK